MKFIGFKTSHLFFFHILIGLITYFNNSLLILLGYTVIFLGIYNTLSGNYIYTLCTVAYFVSFELLCRMASTSPYIPYEISKYLVIILFISYLFKFRKNTLSKLASALLILTLPSLFLIKIKEISVYSYIFNPIEAIVFNFLGFFSLILLIFMFDKMKICIETDFKLILTVFLLPIVSILIFLTLKTGNLNQIEYGLGSNYQASGNFGPNQLATVLGVALFVLFIYYLLYDKIIIKFILGISDIVVLFVLTFFRGLLTFSRGGILSSLFLILLYLFTGNSVSKLKGYKLKITNIQVLFAGLILILSFVFINTFTGGNLLLRYKGESQSTLQGTKEKNIETYTSGRKSIFEEEINLFLENPIFGVGPGLSPALRSEKSGDLINSHNEFGRLLAEHGSFGLLIIFILLYNAINRTLRYKSIFFKYLTFSFFFISLFSASHSAMRLMVTPFFYALACANFYSNKVN